MADRSFIHAEGGIDMQQHVAGNRVHPTKPNTRVRGQVIRDGACAMTCQWPGYHGLNQIHAITLGPHLGLKGQPGEQENQGPEECHHRGIGTKAAQVAGFAQ